MSQCFVPHSTSLHNTGPTQLESPRVDKPHPATIACTRPAVAGRGYSEWVWRKELAFGGQARTGFGSQLEQISTILLSIRVIIHIIAIITTLEALNTDFPQYCGTVAMHKMKRMWMFKLNGICACVTNKVLELANFLWSSKYTQQHVTVFSSVLNHTRRNAGTSINCFKEAGCCTTSANLNDYSTSMLTCQKEHNWFSKN